MLIIMLRQRQENLMMNADDIERIEQTGYGMHGQVGNLEMAPDSFEVRVAEQDLDGVQVGSGFEQLRCKSMTQRVWTHGVWKCRRRSAAPRQARNTALGAIV